MVPVPEQPANNTGAATRAYRLQLTRIGKLKSQLAELDAWAQTHRIAVHQTVHPLQRENRQQLRAMVLLIDDRLAGKSLTAPQRQAAAAVLCGMAATLAREGDAQMAELHDRHSPQTLASGDLEKARIMRAEIEASLGAPLDGLPPDASPEQILAAGMARLQEQHEQRTEEKREKAERRQAKKAGKPSGPPSKAQAQLQDADTLLRTLFRQLASALHPDRESDPDRRAHV